MKKKLLILFFLLFLVIIIILFFLPMRYAQFNTLSDLQTYAFSFPELPKSDNNDWKNPQFTSFYKKYYKIPFVKKIVLKLHLSTYPVLNINYVKQLLKKVIHYRLSKKMQSPFNSNIHLKEGAKCYVWGDLQGAFHSLLRDLSQLQKMGIINNNLEIIQDIHFIFLGDTINRSPYSLETLVSILLLMEKNPQKVFYLKGNQERDAYWESFNMRNELMAREGSIKEKKETHVAINQFFNTLPDVLFIKHKNEKIACFHSQYEPSLLDDITLKIILSGEKGVEIREYNKGLRFKGFFKGRATWRLLSCPTQVYKQFCNFHYDSFVELTIGSTITESILTLYEHDTQEKSKQFQTTYYQAMFGYMLPNKKSDIRGKNIITIGSSMALKKKDKYFKKGFDLAIKTFNTAENKNLILPIFLDDKYKPNLALQNINILYNIYNIDILILATGTPTIEMYLPMIKSAKTALLFPITGAQIFRKPDLKGIIHFRRSYEKELKTLLAYFIKFNIKKFAFFYQNDSFGKPLVQAAHQELKKHNITQWLDLPYTRTNLDFKPLIPKIKAYEPDAIGLFADDFSTNEFLQLLGSAFLFDRLIFCLSTNVPSQNLIDKMGISIFSASYLPSHKSNIEMAKEYIQISQKYKIKPEYEAFEGYISGALLIDAINHLKPPFTKEKIIKYFENMKNYKFKGLTLTFNPKKRDLSQPVQLRIKKPN